MSAIGPYGPNFSTARPANDAESTAADTWCVDCSAAGAADGTAITASFLNVIIAQLRTAIVGRGVTLDNNDDTMLLQAFGATSPADINTAYAAAPVDLAALAALLVPVIAADPALMQQLAAAIISADAVPINEITLGTDNLLFVNN